MKKSRRKKQEEFQRRYDVLKNAMSMFAMSTVAVVAAVTLIPSSPKATIIETTPLETEISYQVEVTDEDNALDLDTLFVVLENQFDYYEQPITLGTQTGYFDQLETDTEYRLSVYGNKGFGQERLATKFITTTPEVGATLFNVSFDTEFEASTYYVDIRVYDPEHLYTDLTLYYGIKYYESEEIIYSSIPITGNNEMIELHDIYIDESMHLYIEGTVDSENVYLDERWITPPFHLHASLYMDYLSSEEVGFYLYNDFNIDVDYIMYVYQYEFLVEETVISLNDSMDHHGSSFTVTDLEIDSTYSFVCIARYIDPQTLRMTEVTIYEEELTTLPEYSYTYDVTTFDTYIEVSITLTDTFDIFQSSYYEMYDTTDEFSNWIGGETYFFTIDQDSKTITYQIQIPDTDHYRIIIGIKSDTDHYKKQIVETIIS